MGFRANPHRAQFSRVDPRTQQGIASRLDRHGDHVLIGTWHRFFLDRCGVFAALPDARNLAGGQAVARDVRPVTDDAHRAVGFVQQGGELRRFHSVLLLNSFFYHPAGGFLPVQA